MDPGNNTNREGKAPSRTPYQTQQLEAFFKECRYPKEKQRRELSRDLGLGQNQIKFWFQNKRNQLKVQSDWVDNYSLRSDNEKLRAENLVRSEMLKNVTCPTCGGPLVGEEELIKRENSQLREEFERMVNEISRMTGLPIADILSLLPESSFGQQQGSFSSPTIVSKNSDYPITTVNKPIEITKDDKIMISQSVDGAVNMN